MLDGGVHRRPGADPVEVGVEFAAAGWSVFLLPEAIVDRRSFFEAARAILPLDPPLVTDDWDALNDSLWTGLDGIEPTRFVIVWPHADSMASRDPVNFEIAVELLDHVADDLADTALTVGPAQSLAIVLV